MNKDEMIVELFFAFRYAKRLLQIDHLTCGCGAPSVGRHIVIGTGTHKIVVARCERH
jgi:hypothetical protein